MDSKEFHKLIEKPQALSVKQIDSLNKIIKDHPYFASARLIKILDLIRKKDPKAHQEIQSSSLYIQDKISIYDELLKIDLPQEANSVSDISKSPVDEGLGENKIEKNDFTNEILDEINIIGKGVKDTVLESFIDTKSVEDKQEHNTEIIKKEINVLQKSSEEKVVEKKEDTTKTEVKEEKTSRPGTKKSLADEVMESLAQMRLDREERLKKMEALENKEKSRKASIKARPITKTTKRETPSQEKEPKKTKKEKKSSPTKSKTKSLKTEVKTSSKESKKKPEQNEEKKPLENKAKSDQKIIESFINKSPRIKPPKESDANEAREDLSKPSTQLPSNLVSENLANIFEKQGKISKAIAIYKQLILKYPEKKSYFAQKLQTLEK